MISIIAKYDRNGNEINDDENGDDNVEWNSTQHSKPQSTTSPLDIDAVDTHQDAEDEVGGDAVNMQDDDGVHQFNQPSIDSLVDREPTLNGSMSMNHVSQSHPDAQRQHSLQSVGDIGTSLSDATDVQAQIKQISSVLESLRVHVQQIQSVLANLNGHTTSVSMNGVQSGDCNYHHHQEQHRLNGLDIHTVNQHDDNAAEVDLDEAGFESVDNKSEQVKYWLHNVVGLGEYYDLFIDNGLDDIDIVKDISIGELESIGISKLGHRKRIYKEIEHLNNLKLSSIFWMFYKTKRSF